MKIEKIGDRLYKIESHSKGKFWTVDLSKNTCNCPHFMYRLKKSGEDCKHLASVKQMIIQSKAQGYDEIIAYVEENVFVDSVSLLERFGEEKVNALIQMGDLIEEHGKIRLL
jgi:predicted nucleic acid-binding Zn finger protein